MAKPVLDPQRGEWVVHTHNLSYFSRLADADTFDRLALIETHRRGVENAGQVAAVLDGAEWLQGFARSSLGWIVAPARCAADSRLSPRGRICGQDWPGHLGRRYA